MLESGNVGVFLSTTHWDWDEKHPNNARPGWGMYPHFAVVDVAATIDRARKAGYRIAQLRGNIVGARKLLWPTRTPTFGRWLAHQNRNEQTLDSSLDHGICLRQSDHARADRRERRCSGRN